MNDISVATVCGNLTRDAEKKVVGDNITIVNFAIASNKNIKKDGEWTTYPIYFKITIFGKYGESLFQYLNKGSKVIVIGDLKVDTYTDNDGNKRESISIVAKEINIMTNKSKDTETETALSKNDDVPF